MTGGLKNQAWLQELFQDLSIALPNCTIVDWIAEGGMGVVAKAHQPLLDRHVAIKVLSGDQADDETDSEAVQRFLAEARAMARLTHPNIVTLYDFGQTESGRFYLVMEYVEGTGLDHLIHAGVLEPGHVLSLGPQICAALEYAHNEGVVHRDIKPANILVTPEGTAKITDFGLARAFAGAVDDALAAKLTVDTRTIGTPDYMAPERMQGGEVDGRADIYALGVMFYEMLVGQTPKGAFRPPSDIIAAVGRSFDEVIIRAMQQNPADRTATAAEVSTQLGAIAREAEEVEERRLRLSRESVGGDTMNVQIVSTATQMREMEDEGPATIAGRNGSPLRIVAIIAAGVVAVGTIALLVLSGNEEPNEIATEIDDHTEALDSEMTDAIPRLASDRGPDGTTAFDQLAWKIRKSLNPPPTRKGRLFWKVADGAPLPPELAPPSDLPTDLIALTLSSGRGAPFLVALKADGTPIAWGDNSYGQTSPPSVAEGANHLVDVCAGDSWVLGLRTDGQLIPWGSMTVYPNEANDIVQIAAAGRYALALDADGHVFLWTTDGLVGPQPVPNAEDTEGIGFDAEGRPIAIERGGRRKRIGPGGNDFFAAVALEASANLPNDRGQYFAVHSAAPYLFALSDPTVQPTGSAPNEVTTTPQLIPVEPAPPAASADPIKPAVPPIDDPRFAKRVALFEKELSEKVIEVGRSGRINLTNRFITVLKTEGNRVYKLRDQAAIDTLLAEIAAFEETGRPSPEPTTNPVIRKARLDWEIASANFELTQANQLGPMLSRFGNDIGTMVRSLTKEGKIDDALAVRAFQENLNSWTRQLRTALEADSTEREPSKH